MKFNYNILLSQQFPFFLNISINFCYILFISFIFSFFITQYSILFIRTLFSPPCTAQFPDSPYHRELCTFFTDWFWLVSQEMKPPWKASCELFLLEHYEHFALGLCWRVYKRRFGSSSAKHKLHVAEMLPNPLFSQSNSHSHSQSQSQSQRRRLLLQVPPSCCPDQNVPIWAHKHAVQNVLQPKIYKRKKKQTRCERGSHGILFSFFWLCSAGFLSQFSCFILRLSVCSLSASLRDLNIYIFFFLGAYLTGYWNIWTRSM